MELLKTKILGLTIGSKVLSSSYKHSMGGLLIKLPFLLYISALIFISVSIIYFFNTYENSYPTYDNLFKQSIKFTFFQAILCTLISICFGFILSLCLYVSNIKRIYITTALNFFFIAPVLFISYGVIFIHGSNGLIQKILHFFNLEIPYSIFGLIGIIYVTSYFNIALSANYFYRKLISVPENYLKLLSANKINFYLALTKYLRPIILNNLLSTSILIEENMYVCLSDINRDQINKTVNNIISLKGYEKFLNYVYRNIK